jgi:hypothetical protein
MLLAQHVLDGLQRVRDRGTPGVKQGLQDRLDDLVAGRAEGEGTLGVGAELRLRVAERDARGDGDEHVYAFHIADELARGKLEAVLVDHERAPRPVHALYARGRAGTPKVRVFLDWAAELIGAHENAASARGRR